MYESIEKNIGIEAAEKFIGGFPLSKSADHNKKFKWAKDVCDYLEENYTPDEIREIRMDCSCQPGEKAEKVKKIYEASTDFVDFCERFNKEYAPGNSLTTDGESLYLIYPECYCSGVKRVEGNLTITWCNCSLGYAEKLFARCFTNGVRAELLESVKMGGEKCVIRITMK